MAETAESCMHMMDRDATEAKVSAETESSGRTLAEVNAIVGYAKLDRSDLKCTSQVLSFSSDVADRDILLLELDTTLLDCLTNGESLTFRGDKEDHAVLCTKDKTYSVKDAETSNSLLLIEDLTFPQSMSGDAEPHLVPREVVGVHHTYLEVTPCRPRLKKVTQLLEQNQFKGQEYEDDNQSSKFTFDDLMDSVQASEDELRMCLREIEAYNIDGYCRLLDFDYGCRLLTHIINLIEENSWSLTSVPKRQVLDTLCSLEPRFILEQCLDFYGYATDAMDENGDVLYRLDENKVCRFFAKMMLKPAGKFNLDDFCDAWTHSVPDGMTTDLGQLEGIALIDRNCRPEVIFYYPVSDLPEEVNERFTFLFKTRPKWTFDDICPFIKCLTTQKLDVNGLLTKFARVTMIKGVRYYSSKKPLA